MEQDKPGLSTKFLLRWSLLELRERFKRSWLATLMVGLCSNSKTVHKAKTSQAARVKIQSTTDLLAVLLYRFPSRQRSPLQFSMGTYRSNFNRHRTQHLVLPLSELQEIIGLAQSDLLEAQGTLQNE